MIFAIAIKNKIETIAILLLLSMANNYAIGQVNEHLFQDTANIVVGQVDSVKTGVFIFIKDGVCANSKANKFLQGLTCLETYEDIDTANFEIFLIKIIINSAVCSNKILTLNKYELQSSFTYDPYRIVLAPSPKNFLSIWKERVDTIPGKLDEVQSLKGTKSPFFSTKDHRDILKLIRRPDHKENYQELKNKYDELKKQLMDQDRIITDVNQKTNIILNYESSYSKNNKK